MAKAVYIVSNRSWDAEIIACVGNLKQVHNVLTEKMSEGKAPAYNQLVKDFKYRKEYHCLRHEYDNDDMCEESFTVTYIENGFINI